jgi:hypothetical protein
LITQEHLKERLNYDPDTGIFTWRTNLYTSRIGKVAGSYKTHERGYVSFLIDGKKYLGHRLAWLYVHGSIPGQIDHINGVTSDNRLCNLRPATSSQNCHNAKKPKSNTSGWKGVNFNSSNGRWQARIAVNGKRIFLGEFDEVKEGAEEYIFAALEHHGEFARFE